MSRSRQRSLMFGLFLINISNIETNRSCGNHTIGDSPLQQVLPTKEIHIPQLAAISPNCERAPPDHVWIAPPIADIQIDP